MYICILCTYLEMYRYIWYIIRLDYIIYNIVYFI